MRASFRVGPRRLLGVVAGQEEPRVVLCSVVASICFWVEAPITSFSDTASGGIWLGLEV